MPLWTPLNTSRHIYGIRRLSKFSLIDFEYSILLVWRINRFCIPPGWRINRFCIPSGWRINRFCIPSVWRINRFCIPSVWRINTFNITSVWRISKFNITSVWRINKFNIPSVWRISKFSFIEAEPSISLIWMMRLWIRHNLPWVMQEMSFPQQSLQSWCKWLIELNKCLWLA